MNKKKKKTWTTTEKENNKIKAMKMKFFERNFWEKQEKTKLEILISKIYVHRNLESKPYLKLIMTCKNKTFFIHCYLETLQHLGHIVSRVFGCVQKAVYFYCCVINVSFVKFTDFNFMIYEFDE